MAFNITSVQVVLDCLSKSVLLLLCSELSFAADWNICSYFNVSVVLLVIFLLSTDLLFCVYLLCFS